MPSSKDPIINRRKAREYRLAHPEWHRRANREWMRKKRAGQTLDERNAGHRRRKERDPAGYLLQHAKWRAKQLGVPMDLTRDDIIVPERCPVFNVPFEWGKGKRGWQNKWSPSLDRINPALGYVKGNIAVISNRANHLKGNGSIWELTQVLEWMKKVEAPYMPADALYYSVFTGPA